MAKREKKNMGKGYDLAPALAAVRQKRVDRERRGEFPAEFMRLSLTDDAYNVIRDMPNSAFREFVSMAIRKAAGRR